MKKDSFVFYLSQYEAIKELTDEQIGRIFRALFLKTTSKQPQNNVVLEGEEKIAFNFIFNQMVVDNEKYIKKCETLRNNAKKGGAPKGNQNAKKQKQPKQPNRKKNNLNDNDNVNDNYYYKKKNIKKKSYYENENLNELFVEFLQLREKLKAVNTERAVNILINKLSSYDDETKIAMIKKSIENSWKSVYEIKKEELPKWFNKDIKVEPVTKEELEEMENLLKEYR